LFEQGELKYILYHKLILSKGEQGA